MKKQNGITLVALVITIIVLLILAGVSISLALGQNGVLTRASGAVSANEKAKVQEELNMSVNEAQTNAQTRKIYSAAYDNSCPYFEKYEESAGVFTVGNGSGEKALADVIGYTGVKVFEHNCQTGTVTLIAGTKATLTDSDTLDYITQPTGDKWKDAGGVSVCTDGSNRGVIKGEYKATNGSGLIYAFAINVETGKVVVKDGVEDRDDVTVAYPLVTEVQ